MSSFRDFMQAPNEVDAVSICKHCHKPIERRGSIWYATPATEGPGGSTIDQLCLKSRSTDHVPIKRFPKKSGG